MSLFQKGEFTLSSGRKSDFRINCDYFTDDDWEAVAYQISKRVTFSAVFGVPTGGIKLERALSKYITKSSPEFPALIVDDVFTTGQSMVDHLEYLLDARVVKYGSIKGFVVFAREKPAHPLDWIDALFKMY